MWKHCTDLLFCIVSCCEVAIFLLRHLLVTQNFNHRTVTRSREPENRQACHYLCKSRQSFVNFLFLERSFERFVFSESTGIFWQMLNSMQQRVGLLNGEVQKTKWALEISLIFPLWVVLAAKATPEHLSLSVCTIKTTLFLICLWESLHCVTCLRK